VRGVDPRDRAPPSEFDGDEDEAGEWSDSRPIDPEALTGPHAVGLEAEEGEDAEQPWDEDSQPAADPALYGDELPPDEESRQEEPPEFEGEDEPTSARGEGQGTPEPEDDVGLAQDDEEEEPSEATRAGPPIQLRIVAGPDAGRMRRFRGVRMVIGRAPGCDWRLSDGSISRRHLELVLGDNGVLLRDLGSGNGTVVNAEKVAEAQLEDGDEIVIGATRISFVDELAALRREQEERERAEQEALAAAEAEEEAARAQADEADEEDADRGEEEEQGGDGEEDDEELSASRTEHPKGGRKRPRDEATGPHPAVVALVLLLVVAGLVGGAVVLYRHLRPRPPDPRIAAATEALGKARAAMDALRFEEAIGLVTRAQELVPGLDAGSLVQDAQVELRALGALEAASALVAAGRLEEARAALEKVELGQRVGEEEKQKVEEQLRQAQRLVERARAAFEAAVAAQDAARAQELFEALPVSYRTDLTPRLGQLKTRLQKDKEAELRKQAQAKVDARRQAAAEKAARQEATFVAVARKFHSGDYERARLECDRVIEANPSEPEIVARAKELKRLIPMFQRKFDDGTRKVRSNALEAAMWPLREARALYRKIAFDGELGTILDEHLSTATLAAARAAVGRNDLATGASLYRETLQINPSEEGARAGLESLQRRAEQLYLEGYMVRDRRPKEAIEKFRLVLELTAAGTDTHEKARAKLAELQP
jgi:pSer/pThr/pTyr-binding forkhead associated (FHA) protein